MRWDQGTVPPQESMGIRALVIPIKDRAGIDAARAGGYRVYVELEDSAAGAVLPPGIAGAVVRGRPDAARLARLRRRLDAAGGRVLAVDERGKWPHIRTNWVTKRGDVLQVASRSAQPWIENNAALIRLSPRRGSSAPALLAYTWTPAMPTGVDQGPRLEDYLVAMAEAGAFGGDLLLPLHPRFQRELVLGLPQARKEWADIRKYLDFYSSELPARYTPLTDIAIVTAEPTRWFEVMNLLGRHNLAYEVVAPAQLEARDLGPFKLLIVLDEGPQTYLGVLERFAEKGGTVALRTSGRSGGGGLPWHRDPPVSATDTAATYAAGNGQIVELVRDTADPNVFALEMRQLLRRAGRMLDIWNGMTVMVAAYEDAGTNTVLVTAVNYAHEALPVQLRIAGTYDLIHYETPEEPARLLPHEHRNGYTEFVLPALRTGGRIFLSRQP